MNVKFGCRHVPVSVAKVAMLNKTLCTLVHLQDYVTHRRRLHHKLLATDRSAAECAKRDTLVLV